MKTDISSRQEYYIHIQSKSLLYRKTILKLIYSAKAGHIGGSLSCVDLLNVLYNHVMDITLQNFNPSHLTVC
jgi:transketolase